MIPPALSRTVVPAGPNGTQAPSRTYGNPGQIGSDLPHTHQPGNNYGGDTPNGHVWAPGVMNPPVTAWRGGADFANENTVFDRHILTKTGDPRTGIQQSTPGNPPNPDGPESGPPRPLFASVNRAMNPQVGSDATANQDDFTRGYATVQPTAASNELNPRYSANRRQDGNYWAGSQGDGWTPVYGGVPGLWQPYGSYSGYTANETKGIQSPAEQGQPGDGPHKVFSGPPHGLHSQTYPSYDSTLGRYMAIPQMHSPRVDRPANSNIAGQDYSQTVVPQGQAGTVAAQPVRFQSQSRFATGG